MKSILISALAIGLAPLAGATEISVGLSEDFQEALNEDYGVREADYLTENIQSDLVRELQKRGVDVARIDVTIVDAKPNKPTFKQLSDTPGLDYGGSISIGGMDLSATAYDASGAPVGELAYDWYETDIRMAGLSTWQDAKRASSKFARKFATQLSGS